jgi:hypothetical protein
MLHFLTDFYEEIEEKGLKGWSKLTLPGLLGLVMAYFLVDFFVDNQRWIMYGSMHASFLLCAIAVLIKTRLRDSNSGWGAAFDGFMLICIPVMWVVFMGFNVMSAQTPLFILLAMVCGLTAMRAFPIMIFLTVCFFYMMGFALIIALTLMFAPMMKNACNSFKQSRL